MRGSAFWFLPEALLFFFREPVQEFPPRLACFSNMRLLALDIGDKRIGLAATDEIGVGVWPQGTLVRKDLDSDLRWLSEKIQALSPQTLVIGLPFNMDGTEGPQAKKVRRFATELEKYLRREGLSPSIAWCDERLTSWEAEQRLTERGLKGKKRKANVDTMAACLILEDYLERTRP
jgi:putative pre-16S rRNA nuclease